MQGGTYSLTRERRVAKASGWMDRMAFQLRSLRAEGAWQEGTVTPHFSSTDPLWVGDLLPGSLPAGAASEPHSPWGPHRA